MSAIEATCSLRERDRGRYAPARARALLVLGVMVVLAAALLAASEPAFAGRSATGKLAFFPCTKCHPVTVDASGKPNPPLPNGFEKHQITLEVHDILGKDEKACLACHDDPARDPGKLILPDGSFVDIKGEVSRVCQRCHFEKFREWEAGIHGRGEAKCSAAGCHDPHTPSWIYVPALPPFQGTGIEVNAVGYDREPFKPLAGPPVNPPVTTPAWLIVATVLGVFAVVGLTAFLVMGRPKR